MSLRLSTAMRPKFNAGSEWLRRDTEGGLLLGSSITCWFARGERVYTYQIMERKPTTPKPRSGAYLGLRATCCI